MTGDPAAIYERVFGDLMPQSMAPAKVAQLRLFTRLAEVGFGDHILPALSKEKRPGQLCDDGRTMIGLSDWPNLKMTSETLPRYDAAFAKALCGLCVRTGNIIAIDVDVLDAELASAIEAAALEILGPAPIRTGKAPKRLLVYRADVLYTKVTIKLAHGANKYLVEMLAKGQHFVAYGEHKDGNPYTWDRELFDVGFDGLTLVTKAQIVAFIGEVERIAVAADFTVSGGTKKDEPDRPKPNAPPRDPFSETFFTRVNSAALGRLADWIQSVFPTAKMEPGTKAWRVTSADLGRGLEEDISFHPVEGGRDFGRETPITPIDAVIDFGDASTPKAAALWLCSKLDIDPKTLGWEESGGDQEDWLAELNSKHFVVMEGGKTVIYRPARDPVLNRDVLHTLQFEDFKKAFMNRFYTTRTRVKDETGAEVEKVGQKNIGAAWLQHSKRRQYLGGVSFAPGRDLGPDYFNLWRGFATPPKAGSWKLIHDHLLKVICSGDKTHFEYLIGWFARCFQRPGEQGEVAVALRGEKGIGKGMVGRIAARIFGQHYLHVVNPEHLVGRFNAHLRDAVFVFGDEAFFAGNKTHEATLKGMITEPQIAIEGKFKDTIMAKNVTHVLLATNSDWVAPMSSDERRYFTLSVPNTRKRDRAYFSALTAEIEGAGPAAMLFDLLQHDLSGFDVRDVPHTAEFDRQKALSLEGLDRVLHDWLQHGEIRQQGGAGRHPWTAEGLDVDKGIVHDAYLTQTKDYRPLGFAEFCKQVCDALKKAVDPDRRPYVDGKLGKRVFGFAKLQHCRDAFAKHANAAITWETDLPEAAETPSAGARAGGVFDA